MLRKLSFILSVIFLWSISLHAQGQASELDRIAILSSHNAGSPLSTMNIFWVDGIAPWDLGTLRVTGPGEVEHVQYNVQNQTFYTPQDEMVYGTLWAQSTPLADGDYTFELRTPNGTVLDTKSIGFTYNQIDSVNISSASPSAGSYVNTTTPTFTWTGISDETATQYYRITIRNYNTPGIVYTSSKNTATSLILPADILKPDTSYKWRVETFDGDTLAASNGSTSDWSSFSTGSANPTVTPLNVSSVYTRSRVRADGGHRTQFGVWGVSGPSPDHVAVVVTGPLESGTPGTYPLNSNNYDQDGYYFDYNGELVSGTYRFTITDSRPGANPASVIVERAWTANWTQEAPNDDEYSIASHAYIDTDRPTIAWNSTGADNYRVKMFSYDQNTSIPTIYTTATQVTVSPGTLKKNSAYWLRVEAYDAAGNRSDGATNEFFVANSNDPANISGTVAAGSSGAGGPIYIAVTNSPVFPGGEEIGFAMLNSPGGYTIYNVPRGVDLYVHALYDKDGSESYTVGDYKGRYSTAVNLPVTAGTLENPGKDFALSDQVQAAAVSGTVSCANYTSGSIYVAAFAYDDGDESPIAEVTLSGPGSYILPNMPVDGQLWIKAYWDADNSGSGGPTALDHLGNHPANPVTVVASGNTGIGISIETTGFIAGYVKENATTPIPGLHVYVQDSTTGNWIAGANTDATGFYFIPLATGTYDVTACPDCNNQAYVSKRENNILVTNLSVTTVDFSLNVGGTITGTVLASDGMTPVANLRMIANDWDTDQDAGGARTDANGNFAIHVDAGSYSIQTCPACDNLPYPRMYYNNSIDRDNATKVTVTDGAPTPNINFQLLQTFEISGKVTTTGATPAAIANGCVYVETSKCNGGYVAGGETDASGTYHIYVPAGTSYYVKTDASCNGRSPANKYYINATYDGSTGSEDCNNSQAVAVGPDAENINFSLHSGGIISGRVFDSNGIALTGYGQDDGYNVGISISIGDCSNLQNVGWTAINTDGTYTTRGLPAGSYHLQAQMRNTPYLDEYWADPASLSYCNDQTVAVTIGAEESGKDFQLDSAMLIQGKVYHSGNANNTLENVHIEARNSVTFGRIATADTDENGNYSLRVPAAEYYINACPSCNAGSSIYLGEWWNNTSTPINRVDVRTQNRTDIDFDLSIGASVTGTIYDAFNSAPITGVPELAVEAFTGDPCGPRQYAGRAQIDPATGQYTLGGLPAGNVFLVATTACSFFVEQYYDSNPTTADHCQEDPLQLVVGQPATIDFSLLRGGKILGTVTRSDGVTPIGNVHVSASDKSTGSYITGSNTATNGNYCMAVPAQEAPTGNEYKIHAFPEGSSLAFINEYYQDKFTFMEANNVKVIRNTETNGISFSLNSIVHGDINGDEVFGLADVVMGLQVLAGKIPVAHLFLTGDANGDGKINMEDILRMLGEL